jgi:hypothetical protein
MRLRYAISTDGVTWNYLFQAHVVAPLSDYTPHSKVRTLGDGSTRGAGWPIATWYWKTIEEAERNVLRAYCPLTSAKDIYIITKDDEREWIEARTTMMWMPETEDIQNDSTVGLTIKFRIKTRTIITP